MAAVSGNTCRGRCDDDGLVVIQEGCKKCKVCGWSACTV